MSMLDIHSQAIQQVNEGLHNFLLRYKATSKLVYGFVEGKDDPMYYRNIIERFLPEDWSVDLIRAGNKNKVLRCLQEIDWSSFDRKRVCFFVDRDLDDLTGSAVVAGSNIYITDGYSIENSIVNSYMAIRLLNEVYNIVDLTLEEEKKICDIFEEDMAKFKLLLTPVMAQIVHWRRNKENTVLDNIKLDKIFAFSGGRLQTTSHCRGDMEIVASAAADVSAQQCDENLLKSLKGEFAAAEGPNSLIRGKYLAWFLNKFISVVWANISIYSSTYRSPPKMKVTIGPSSIHLYAAPRAKSPASLRNFIEQNYLSFINGLSTPASVGKNA